MTQQVAEMVYSTSDIYFAAYLCATGMNLINTQKDEKDSKKVIFVFKIPMNTIERIKAAYFGGSADVKAKKFVEQIKSLKEMIHA